MSSLTIRPALTNVTSKWQLACNISERYASEIEQVVKAIFNEIIQGLETAAKTNFESEIKEKIWKATSTPNLDSAEETFILEVHNQILKDFSEQEALEALTKYKTKGVFKDILLCIQNAYKDRSASIIDAVTTKTQSMARSWMPKIVSAIAFEELTNGVETGDLNKVKEAIKNGADPNGYNIICRACEIGNVDIVRELLDNGAKVNKELADKLILKVFKSNSYELVKLLLDIGADPNLRTADGVTLLSEAIYFPTILQLMLDRGAKANVQNSACKNFQNSKYPLHLAARFGLYDSLNILLKAGADPEVKDDYGKTPIELARSMLNNQQTDPRNSPEVTAEIIESLEKIIALLESLKKSI